MEIETIVISCLKCQKQGRKTEQAIQPEYYKPIAHCEKCGSETFWEIIVLDHSLQDEIEKIKQDDFVHLHVHTEYSLLDGFGHPKEFVKCVKELNQKAVAITDHGSLAGHYKWYDACTKEGIKPILGCELYVVDKISEKERNRYHITVLAKNNDGLVNLNRLVSYSYKDGFYYHPRVDWEVLSKYSDGLIATSGCPAGKTANMLIIGNANLDQIVKELKRQKEIFKDYYLEFSPWNYPEGKRYAKVLYEAAAKTKLPMVLTMDVHYPRKEQERTQDVMLCIQTRTKHHDTNRMKFSQFDFYLKSAEEMEESWRSCFPNLEWKKQLVTNTKAIADKIKITFPKAKSVSFPFLGDKNEHLRESCKAQLELKGLSKNKEYSERMKRELDLIVQKNFVDYFLVIADLVHWAKKQGIYVGAARGSGCGSLVCYLTGITTIDPLPYGLMFERFIDVNRADLPDIDLDFEDERRGEVKKYLMDKYGSDRVASLSTYGTFGGRMCLQDVGRVFDIPAAVIEEVKNLVVKRSGGDSRYGFSVEDTFTGFETAASWLQKYPQLKFAKNLEGYIRNKGVHAAGVIISDEPIENIASCYYDHKTGDRIIHMDYDDIKKTGLLKIDVLGLTALTVFRKCAQMIKKRKGIDIVCETIDLNDDKVFKAFRQGKCFGIFQFDGQAVMGVCRQVQPKSFKELFAINALGRPGALHSGGASFYIERKDGKKQIEYAHPLMKEITEETFGVAIYQEQVMQTVRLIGKFDWDAVGESRRLMAKSQGVESFNKYRDKFVAGAKTNGLNEEKADQIWKTICTFGSWAFSKSHSVAYTTMGYWMMWLKVYHPLEFYCSLLQCEKDDVAKRKIIKEFVNDGGQLLPVDVNRSKQRMTVDKKGLRVGLLDVKGIGEAVADKIVEKQPFDSVQMLKAKVKKESAIETLLKIGSCSSLPMGHRELTMNLFEDMNQEDSSLPPEAKIEDVIEFCPSMVVDKVHQNWKHWVQENIKFEIDTKKGKDKYELLTVKQLDKIQKRMNVVLIGRTDRDTQFKPKNRIDEAGSKGTVMEVEQGKRKDDYGIIDMTVEDETSFVMCRFSHDLYPRFKDQIWATKPSDVVLIAGWCSPDFLMVFSKMFINLTVLRKKLDEELGLTDVEKSIIK